MHFIRGKALRDKRWIPAFAVNDEQLKKVIAFSAYLYADNNRRQGKLEKRAQSLDAAALRDIAALEELTEKRLEDIRAQEHEMDSKSWHAVRAHINAVTVAGGYAQRLASIAWLAWRCGYAAKDILDTMVGESNECDIRQNLNRMIRRAKALGYETLPPRTDLSVTKWIKRRARLASHRHGRVRYIVSASAVPDPPKQHPDYTRYVSFCNRVGTPAMNEEQWRMAR